VSKTLSVISGYTLDLKNYGDYEEQTINQKNFGYLCKTSRGVKAFLNMEQGIEEGRVEMAGRTADKFVGMRTLNKFANPPS
jgi:hypothetical protein